MWLASYAAVAKGTTVPRTTIAPLRFTLARGHSITRCRKSPPASAHSAVATTVRVDGQVLTTANTTALGQYYAGHGTLVEVYTKGGMAPLCAKATTWLKHARLQVSFQIV